MTTLTRSGGGFARLSAQIHRQNVRLAGWGLLAGLLLTLSVPPYGWWPLAMVGFGVLYRLLEDQGWRDRLVVGLACGLGLFGPGLFWITDFTLPGYVALTLLELSFLGLAAVLTPPARWRPAAFPAAVVVAEALRGVFPFEGFPLGGVALGQVSGPLAFAARISGPLVLVGLAAALGASAVEALRRHWLAPAVAVSVTILVVVAGVTNGSTKKVGTLTIAAVQGGGVRGLRAVHADPAAVFQAHLDASELVKPPVDVTLWPEDVVDLDHPLEDSPEADALSTLAQRLQTTLLAGIVEDVGFDHFRNAAVVWDSTGAVIDRYDKVHRVPFGEYVPGRSLIEHLVNLSVIPRDAIPGHGPGLVRTPAGRLGVLISYEVFFADRARAAVRAGGEVVLVPTNASSYKTSQVPTQELAAARLRAIETGRDVVQAGPTGYSALIDDRGKVMTRTTLGRRQVRQGTVDRRHGQTPYTKLGDSPIELIAFAVLAGAAWRSRSGRS